jgi:hypothetical protein
MNGRVGVDDYITETNATAADVDALPRATLWPELAAEALYGLTGRIVEAIDPHTEAAPVAILAHLLVGIGNLVGPDVHARVQEDPHPCRLNVALVGDTSKGRKGTAWGTPRELLRRVDPDWVERRVRSGLSSGEGLIYHVRDAREEQQPIKEKGRVVSYENVRVDEGEPDKRLLVLEPELASVLKRMKGETNSLSAVIRDGWDHGTLATLTKNSPLRATRAHVSVIGHITREELGRELTATERANGFANRFLFLLVRRSKVLPEGGRVPAATLDALADELRRVVAFARTAGELRRDDEARAIWAEVYPGLSKGEPGMVGAIISRAEAQALRLQVLYALLDRSPTIRPEHLSAALAVWDYAEASARLIFGERLGWTVADTILDALRTSPRAQTELHDLFGRHRRADEINEALSTLKARGLVQCEEHPTAGRAAQVWRIA